MQTFAPSGGLFWTACAVLLCAASVAACRTAHDAATPGTPATGPISVIPKPAAIHPMPAAPFVLTPDTRITVDPGNSELVRLGDYLASILRPATGFALPVRASAEAPGEGDIHLGLRPGASASAEAYELHASPDGIVLRAAEPEGVFRGLQTLRQLFPTGIERPERQAGPWMVPAVHIADHPRFAWRGAMLDVARHFFGVDDVKRFIDLIAYYKINRLHLHLSDDQGWRIMINAWPELARHGGSTQVGGGPGGYYTQEQYADIVAYAQSRYITIVPEIDMPGHTNAALASYPELNCDDTAPALYTGIQVGFSSLCVDKEITFTFVDDVIRELAALTPGPYIHIGGDEVKTLTDAAYNWFIERAQQIVLDHGKRAIGWNEIAKANLLPGTVVQYWAGDSAEVAVEKGARFIMSPATKTYLDMKYDSLTTLGLNWAGYTDVADAYTWDPAHTLEGVTEAHILGVEAPLWTETAVTMNDIEYLVFPRLAGHAEVGWSPAEGRTWAEYRQRLAAHGPRLSAMGVDFYRSPQVDWHE